MSMNSKLTSRLAISLVVFGFLLMSCDDNPSADKISSVLQQQINLRNQQLANPSPERLDLMKSLGMNTADLNIQRIYIYLEQPITTQQVSALHALGVTLYLNSWIPPVGNDPLGVILADLPVSKLNALAAKDYVKKLETAEKPMYPQSDTT